MSARDHHGNGQGLSTNLVSVLAAPPWTAIVFDWRSTRIEKPSPTAFARSWLAISNKFICPVKPPHCAVCMSPSFDFFFEMTAMPASVSFFAIVSKGISSPSPHCSVPSG